MTLTTTTVRNAYSGSGTTGPFPYSFRIFAATDLAVTKTSAAGADTTLAYPADYSVSGVGNATGGSVTLTTALATGEALTIRRAQPLTQTTSIKNQGPFLPETVETALDRLNAADQQQQDQLDRAVRVKGTTDPSGVTLEVSPETAKVLGWLSSTQLGNVTVDTTGVTLPGEGRTVTTTSAYLLNNRVYNVLDYGATGNGSTNDRAAIQAAITAAGAGGTILFPPGTYVLGSQIATTAVKQTLVGAPGAVLKRQAGASMAEGPAGSGAYCMVYLGHAECRIVGFGVDGNKAAMGWSTTTDVNGIVTGTDTTAGRQVYQVLIAADDCLADGLHLYNGYSGNAFGGGLMVRRCARVRVTRVTAHDNGGNGITIYGNASRCTASDCVTYSNGYVGFEVEGDGTFANAPSQISITNLVSSSNSAQNFMPKFALDVTVTGLTCLAGGNNGSVKILNSRRVALSGFTIRDGFASAAAPFGIWVHREQDGTDLTGGAQHVVIANGVISGLAGASAADAIRITDSASYVTIRGVIGTGCSGYGVNVDTATLAPAGTAGRTPDYVLISDSFFAGNTLGAFGGSFASISNRWLWNCAPGLENYTNANINMNGDLYRAGTKVVGARQAAITSPTGGGTIDTQARTAIDAIRAALTAHGLTS